MNKFTNINFIPVTFKNGLLGFVNCVYDNNLYLSSIAVKVKNDGTLYLLCPSKKFQDTNLQYYYPINSETYNSLLEAVRPIVGEFLRGKEGSDE